MLVWDDGFTFYAIILAHAGSVLIAMPNSHLKNRIVFPTLSMFNDAFVKHWWNRTVHLQYCVCLGLQPVGLF